MKNKKKKNGLMFVLMFVFGALIGIMLISAIDKLFGESDDAGVILFRCFAALLWLYIAFFLHIIIHETGHLIFGLLTGYTFSSFRIFSFLLMRENGKFKIKRYSLAGTGGQCLLAPPAYNNGDYPWVLYNLGGILTNTITGVVALILCAVLQQHPIPCLLLLLFGTVGLMSAVLNGIPIPMNGVENDGCNLRSAAKNKLARRSLWIQLAFSDEQLKKGVRLKDMPSDWFAVPWDRDMDNGLNIAIGVIACQRFMDMHDFDEAKRLADHLLSLDSISGNMSGCQLATDRLYCELIGERNPFVINSLLTEKQKNMMKAMRRSLSVMRTQYAYALLFENDRNKAMKLKAQFETVCRKYPYKNDIVSENELIVIAENIKSAQ